MGRERRSALLYHIIRNLHPKFLNTVLFPKSLRVKLGKGAAEWDFCNYHSVTPQLCLDPVWYDNVLLQTQPIILMRQISSSKVRKNWSSGIISYQLLEYTDAAHTGFRCSNLVTHEHIWIWGEQLSTYCMKSVCLVTWTEQKCEVGKTIKTLKSGEVCRAIEVILCLLPYLHHSFIFSIRLSFWPWVHFLFWLSLQQLNYTQEVRVDCQTGWQWCFLENCVWHLSPLEGLGCSSKCCTIFLEEESPQGLWTVPLNVAPQVNLMTSLINWSRTRSPVILSTYRSLFEILHLCTKQMANMGSCPVLGP